MKDNYIFFNTLELYKIFILLIAVGTSSINGFADANSNSQIDRKTVVAALKSKWNWYVYSNKKDIQFRILGTYSMCSGHEGKFYRGVEIKKNLYLMDIYGRIFWRTWNNRSLLEFVTPVEQYIDILKQQIKKTNEDLNALSKKLKAAQQSLEKLKDAFKKAKTWKAKKLYLKAIDGLEDLRCQHKNQFYECQDAKAKYKRVSNKYKILQAKYGTHAGKTGKKDLCKKKINPSKKS